MIRGIVDTADGPSKGLSLSRKISRLCVRLRDSEWRHYGMLLLLGKLSSVCLLLLGVAVLYPELTGFKALAADAVDVKGTDIVNPLNTMWTLVAAFGQRGRSPARLCRRRILWT